MHVNHYILFFFFCQAFYCFFGIISKTGNSHLCTITMVDFTLFKRFQHVFAIAYFAQFKSSPRFAESFALFQFFKNRHVGP